jgi:hypothetical protein
MHLRLGSLSALTGEYVLFLRGDSYLRPRVLERIDSTGIEGKIVLSPVEFIGGVNGKERLNPPERWTPEALLEAGPLPPGIVAWPRGMLEENFSDLQRLQLGPFGTLAWLLFAHRSGREALVLEEPAVEMWDDRDGPSCWTGLVFETLFTLGSILKRWDGHGNLADRIVHTIRSLPSEFRPHLDEQELTEAERLEWLTSRIPLVE